MSDEDLVSRIAALVYENNRSLELIDELLEEVDHLKTLLNASLMERTYLEQCLEKAAEHFFLAEGLSSD